MAVVEFKNIYVIGIDPGFSTGLALLKYDGQITIQQINQSSPEEAIGIIKAWTENYNVLAIILEKVHSMPKQGVKSMFTFGKHYGIIIGGLIAMDKGFIEIHPRRWHQILGSYNSSIEFVKDFFNLELKKQNIHIADAIALATYFLMNLIKGNIVNDKKKGGVK